MHFKNVICEMPTVCLNVLMDQCYNEGGGAFQNAYPTTLASRSSKNLNIVYNLISMYG